MAFRVTSATAALVAVLALGLAACGKPQVGKVIVKTTEEVVEVGSRDKAHRREVLERITHNLHQAHPVVDPIIRKWEAQPTADPAPSSQPPTGDSALRDLLAQPADGSTRR